LLQIQKWMGADLGVPEKKPQSQGEMQIYFGVDKGTVRTATAPAPPYASSWVPRNRVCVASKRTRLEKLFLARGRLGNSIYAEPTKLYPGGQASTATQWTLLRNGTQGPEDPTSDSPLLHSKYPRAMNLVTCGTTRRF
jgi:hypothetical protein